jgi:hypothetical protein
MYNHSIPNRDELPSTAKLIRSTILAAIVAVILLVTVVMPAEYALDPTGAGRILGLTEMGEIKEQLADEAAADAAMQNAGNANPSSGEPITTTETSAMVVESTEEPAAVASAAEQEQPKESREPQWKDEVSFVLTPGQGTEYKLTMQEGAVAQYYWVSEGGPINFDAHGNGSGQSISYEKGRGVPSDEGELKAAFTGDHGWFFRNRNDTDITLTLKTKGDYGKLKKVI